MKKSTLTLVIFFALMLITAPIYASLPEYTFTSTIGSYTEVTGGTLLGNSASNDEYFVNPASPLGSVSTFIGPGFPIGFNFTFDDYVFDVIGVSNDGWISFGQSSLGNGAVHIPYQTVEGIEPHQLACRVAGLHTDLIARSNSSLRIVTTGTAPNRVCTIQWKNYLLWWSHTTENVNFQIQLLENGNKVRFAYGNFAVDFNTQRTPEVALSGYDYDDHCSIGTTTGAWIDTSVEGGAMLWLTYEFYPPTGLRFTYSPPVYYPNDLWAFSLEGNLLPVQGSVNPYTITVKNRGTSPQANYTVRLMNGANELASVAGPPIQANESIPVIINYAFTDTGAASIFGEVVLEGEQNPANNQTTPLEVHIQPQGTALIEIGTGFETLWQPFSGENGHECAAALYTAEELFHTQGDITAIKWYCLYPGVDAIPYKIFLKTIADSLLTACHWDSLLTGATFMQEGTYDFNQAGWVTFTFAAPFHFNGTNLLVLTETNCGGNGNWQSPDFRATTSLGTSLYWSAYGGVQPSWNGTFTWYRPNIGVFLITNGNGALQGTVSYQGIPLEGAVITVGDSTAISAANGTYSFSNLNAGGYTGITCCKEGYYTQSLSANIISSQTTTLDINMVTQSEVTLTGRIITADGSETGLAEARIDLVGYSNYSAVSDSSGYFIIENIFANQTYSYIASKAGYTPASGSISIGNTDFIMDDTSLVEIPYPVTNIQVADSSAYALISWTTPQPDSIRVLLKSNLHRNERSLLGYKVWRLLPNQQWVPQNWILLTPTAIDSATYCDYSWTSDDTSWYRYAVKALYSNQVESEAAFSSTIQYTPPYGTVRGTVDTPDYHHIPNAIITVGDSITTSNSVGYYSIKIPAGTYTLTCSAQNYNPYTFTNLVVINGQPSNIYIPMTAVTGVNDELEILVTELKSISPNPFSHFTSVKFDIKESVPVHLNIYNIKGQIVNNLVTETKTKGHFNINWTGKDKHNKDLASGIYFIRMNAGNYSAIRKVMLMR